MIRYLADVLSGRVSHWNGTAGRVVSETTPKIENLPSPSREILRLFLASTYLLFKGVFVERLSPSRVPLKNFDYRAFQSLHTIVLTYFAVLFSREQPDLFARLKRDLLVVAPDRILCASCFDQFEVSVQELRLPRSQQNPVSISVTADACFRISQIVGFSPTDFVQWMWFQSYLNQMYLKTADLCLAETRVHNG